MYITDVITDNESNVCLPHLVGNIKVILLAIIVTLFILLLVIKYKWTNLLQ